MTKIVSKNTTIPTKQTRIFSTAADLQTAVTIRVLQGESAMASDNLLLGTLELDAVPAPKGVPQIEVGVEIDASEILRVVAKDLGTGKKKEMSLSRWHALSGSTNTARRGSIAETPDASQSVTATAGTGPAAGRESGGPPEAEERRIYQERSEKVVASTPLQHNSREDWERVYHRDVRLAEGAAVPTSSKNFLRCGMTSMRR